jgi:hypothetical protein
LLWYSVCVHPLYMLLPLFLVLFYFHYNVLCSRFSPNTFTFLSLSNFVIPSKCLKNFTCTSLLMDCIAYKIKNI